MPKGIGDKKRLQEKEWLEIERRKREVAKKETETRQMAALSPLLFARFIDKKLSKLKKDKKIKANRVAERARVKRRGIEYYKKSLLKWAELERQKAEKEKFPPKEVESYRQKMKKLPPSGI